MKKYVKYLITAAIGLAIAFLIICLKGTFTKDNAKDVMHILTDAFFVAGVLISGYGILVIASNGGTFDMFAYGFISIFQFFKKDYKKRKYKDFYEYRKTKQASPRPFFYLVIVGLFYIAISMIFLILYYKFQ